MLRPSQRRALQRIDTYLRKPPLVGDPRKPPHYTAWAGHHFYWGLIVETVGFCLVFSGPLWLALILIGIGLHWNVDDILQHIHQGYNVLWWKAEPDYVSPVHRWYWAVLTWMLWRSRPGWFRDILLWLRRH